MNKILLIWIWCIRTKQHLQGSSSQSLKLVLQNSRCMNIPFSPAVNRSAPSRLAPLRKNSWVRLEATQTLKHKYMSSSLQHHFSFWHLLHYCFMALIPVSSSHLCTWPALNINFFFSHSHQLWKNYQLIMKASMRQKFPCSKKVCYSSCIAQEKGDWWKTFSLPIFFYNQSLLYPVRFFCFIASLPRSTSGWSIFDMGPIFPLYFVYILFKLTIVLIIIWKGLRKIIQTFLTNVWQQYLTTVRTKSVSISNPACQTCHCILLLFLIFWGIYPQPIWGKKILPITRDPFHFWLSLCPGGHLILLKANICSKLALLVASRNSTLLITFSLEGLKTVTVSTVYPAFEEIGLTYWSHSKNNLFYLHCFEVNFLCLFNEETLLS